MLIFSIGLYTKGHETRNPGLFDQPTWDAFKWLEKNTPKTSHLLFVYGDNFYQGAIFWTTKRVPAWIEPIDFIPTTQSEELKTIFPLYTQVSAVGNAPIEIGFFKYDRINETNDKHETSICQFDYLIFRPVSRNQAITEYNKRLLSFLKGKQNMKEVYQNNAIIILKNPKKGECNV